jgi:hypothetical protein
MSAANILIYIALIGFIIYRRTQGRPVESVKKLLILPVVLTVIGWQDMAHAHLNNIDITVTVIGCALSLGLGGLRGAMNKVDDRDGLPWVRWGGASLAVFAINVAAKLILDVGGVAVGGTTSGVTSSLLLAVGLMMVGEALVTLARVQSSLPGTASGWNGARRP